MHIIINNKNFSYYFIVDGAIKGSGTIAAARSPLWEISYKINSTGDSMLLKNISTKYYNNTVSVYSLTDEYFDGVYPNTINTVIEDGKLIATTTVVGPTDGITSDVKVLYALYDADGKLIDVSIGENVLNLVGVENEYEITLPDYVKTGDILTVKEFIWNVGSMEPVSVSASRSHTVQ